MDTIFLLTLLLIFVSALVGVFVQRRSRDRCLRDFEGFQVTLELENGKSAWGRLLVFPQGFELVYAQPHCDTEGHEETSFVVMGDLLPRIRSVARFHDELNQRNQQRRLREVRLSHHPGPWRRTRRAVRNFFNTFRDAFRESFGVAFAQVQKGGGAPVLPSQDKRVTQVGDLLLGMIPNAYEPLLERYVGHRVVVEELLDGSTRERPGILKEYSAEWIELLDHREPEEHVFSLANPERVRLNRDLDVVIRKTDAGLALRLENHGERTMRLARVEIGEAKREIGVEIAAGGVHEQSLIELPEAWQPILDKLPSEIALRASERSDAAQPADLELPDLALVLEAWRAVDLCLLRRRATLRHGGEFIGRPAEGRGGR